MHIIQTLLDAVDSYNQSATQEQTQAETSQPQADPSSQSHHGQDVNLGASMNSNFSSGTGASTITEGSQELDPATPKVDYYGMATQSVCIPAKNVWCIGIVYSYCRYYVFFRLVLCNTGTYY